MKSIKRILFPTDFSENSYLALDYAVNLAKVYGAQLYLLHVINKPLGYDSYLLTSFHIDEIEKQATSAARQAMLELIQTRIDEKVRVKIVLARGVPFAEIVDTAKTSKTDLIIMGTHGRTGVPQMLIGSVAEKVVRNAPCPVLTVKPADSLEREIKEEISQKVQPTRGQLETKTMRPSKKFFLGLVLIIANFVVGKVAVPFFALAVELGIAIYLVSWLMLIVGLFLCGREGLGYARMYYRHFERKIKMNALRRFKRKQPPQIHKDKPTPLDV
jgi:nucleotide-binding universal stress UspA family protein